MAYRILIADDEPDLLAVVCFRMKKAGFEISTAANGRQALEKIRAEKPDLVLVDYRMPLMDGLAVCAAMHQEEGIRHIPAIVMTASTESTCHRAQGSLPEGVVGFIIKPFEPDQFLKTVMAFLPKRDGAS